MGKEAKREHQTEPWMQDGRNILDSRGWTLASAQFPDDARRIVAAINAVQGIPTDALESWSVNVIGAPIESPAAGGAGPSDGSDSLPNERRVGSRRHGDRRESHHTLSIFGAGPHREGEGGKDSR